MQMSVDRDVLLKALDAALGAITKKAEIPILTHVHLSAEHGCGTLRGCDLEMQIATTFPAENKKTGSVAVPARLFHDIVKRLPAKAMLAMSLGEDRKKLPQLKIAWSRSRFQLGILEPDDFPALEWEGKSPMPFELPSNQFAAMLHGVQHAWSNDETRYYLGGIYLHYDPSSKRLKAVATNGHILAMHAVESPAESDLSILNHGVIFPRRTVGQVLKMLPDNDEPVQIAVSERMVNFKFPNDWELTSKLIDGKFPDYQRVIPTDNPHAAKLLAADLATVSDRVSTVCEGDSPAIVVCFKPAGGITVTANAAGKASGRDEMAAEIEGAKAAIGLNARYLAAILGSIDGSDDVELRYNSASDPVLIRVEGHEDIRHVIMPIRADHASVQVEEAA